MVGGRLGKHRAEVGRENVDVLLFTCSAEEEVVLLVSHLFTSSVDFFVFNRKRV